MKILIITVAGSSTRFSKSIGKEVLKCIFYDRFVEEALLYKMILQPIHFDKYIIVGGYKYELLELYIKHNLSDYVESIDLIYNEHYEDYGSGYSLYCGLKQALKYPVDEIVFAEGDLYVDSNNLLKVANSPKSVITINREPILANKAVAFYIDVDKKIKYIYDPSHKSLRIAEDFLGIYNSGQIWKFSNHSLVKEIYTTLEQDEWKDTNLIMVENYFRSLNEHEYEIICFEYWINCNTVEDFFKTLGNEK